MIGERNVIEVEMGVLRLERAPAAVEAAAAIRLHADDPLARPVDRVRIGRIAVAVQQHADDGGIVHIRVMRVFILKRPAARPQPGAAHRPVAGNVQDLFAPAASGRRYRSRCRPPAMAWPARPVSQTGDRQGWQ